MSEYAQLLAEVRRVGLLERSYSWWQLTVAAYLGVVFAQVGFLGHDAGHQQVFRDRRCNDRLGLVLSNLGIGLSYGWWIDKHTRHHRNPNEVGRDPDVQRNVLAWTEQQARSRRGLLRIVTRHQDAFFFPLLLLEGWNLHAGSIRVLIGRRRGRLLEVTLLVAHTVGGLTLLLAVMPPIRALLFVVVLQSVFGLYLGSTFAPNHKGMQIVDAAARPDFLRRQVLTSRNITGGRSTSMVFGGLNYQIEHHLFPSMPTRNLRRCGPLAKAFCHAHDVAYTETGVFDSYRRALRYLRSLRPDGTACAVIPTATRGVS